MGPLWTYVLCMSGVLLLWSFGALSVAASEADRQMANSIHDAMVWCEKCRVTIWKEHSHPGPSQWDEYGTYIPHYCSDCWDVVQFQEAVRGA